MTFFSNVNRDDGYMVLYDGLPCSEISNTWKWYYAVLRSELEHARDIAKGAVPKQSEKHFSRYEGLNEGEVASEYVYKKATRKANILKEQQIADNFNNKVKQYESEGFTFEQTTPDGFGEQRYNLKDINGNQLGYVEYTIKDNVLTIDEVVNSTKRKIDWKTQEKLPKAENEVPSTPNIAEKLIDKVISEHPNLNIKWDAVTNEGRKFKERYLGKHPELTNKITGISSEHELDLHLENDYNAPKKGGIDEEGNQSGNTKGYRSPMAEDSISNDRAQTKSNSTQAGERVPDTEGNLHESDSRTDTRRKTANSDLSSTQLKLDFSQAVETKQSTGDIVTLNQLKGITRLHEER